MSDTLSLVARWVSLWRTERALRLGDGGADLSTVARMRDTAERELGARIGASALSGLTQALYEDERRLERAS